MFAPLAAIAALCVLSSIEATPTRRVGTFCDQLVVSCANSGSQAISDPWTIPACIYGATCFGGSRPVDGFLLAVATERNEPNAVKASLNVPGLTLETFNKISTDKKIITQQNFIDGVYSTLDATKGPYPDVSLVISSFQRVNIWTQFCNGPGIPWKNFADYFKYSATVNSPGCSPISSTTLTITQATRTVTPSPVTSATSLPLLSSGIYTNKPTTITTTGPIITPPSYPIISIEPSCQNVFETCARVVDYSLSDTWSFNSCLFAATCIGGGHNVDTLLSVLYVARTGNYASFAPKSLNQARFSEAQFKKISSNGRTITLQNWIDAYYGLLATSGGPWPASAAVVIAEFKRIQSWTVFCGGDGVPYKNIADYFQYSSTVSSPNAC